MKRSPRPERPTYHELSLMVDIFCACIETRTLPTHSSPCHHEARDMVRRSGFEFKRHRTRLKPLPTAPHA